MSLHYVHAQVVHYLYAGDGMHSGDPAAPDRWNPDREGVCDGCLQLVNGDTGIFATDDSGLMWHDTDCAEFTAVRDDLI